MTRRTHFRNKFETTISESIVVSIEERPGDSTERSVFVDQFLHVIHNESLKVQSHYKISYKYVKIIQLETYYRIDHDMIEPKYLLHKP